MEKFFRDIGEEIFVPQVSLFFRRGKGKDVLLTVPNLHPGPMGEIGGGNLPKIVHDYFAEETLVPHGCATHDFNLVAESEITKVIDAVQGTKKDLAFSPLAGKSGRVETGSVRVLYQRFSDTVLMVATRSPERTEDLDYGIGMAVMSEGHRYFAHVAFIDAHNCMTDLSSPVHLGTLTATEYLEAAHKVFDRGRGAAMYPFRVGVSHRRLPFSREQGLGDLGVQVLVVEVEGQKTAYVLLDGNNMAQGVRELLLDQVLTLVDNAEIMTTDSHVVNTITGKNPVGENVPAAEIAPHVLTAVEEAINDLGTAETAGSTAQCERVVVFGSTVITQFASTVNAILVFIAPLSLAFLLLAFLLSLVAFIMIA
jgi:putative membrane protein